MDWIKKYLSKYDWLQVCGILIIAFSGFYLKLGIFSPVYISFVVCGILWARFVYVGKLHVYGNAGVYVAILFAAYCVMTQFLMNNFSSALINTVFSVAYYILAYQFICNISTKRIFKSCYYLFYVSIALMVVEAFWRVTHPVLEQPSFYKYKFNSIMYIDSNFVAVFALSLYFFAMYLEQRCKQKTGTIQLLLVVICIFTLSRAAILVLVVFTFLFTNRIGQKIKLYLVGVGVVAAMLLLFILSKDESLISKLFIVMAAKDYLMTAATVPQLLFGVGFGQAIHYLGIGSHNFLVTSIVENGIIGMVLQLALLGTLLWCSKWMSGYVLLPFLVVGMSMAPHFIPYIYCECAIIVTLERRRKKYVLRRNRNLVQEANTNLEGECFGN